MSIRTFDLTKRFNNFTAVDHVNISIMRGEIFGLLGPNGAGKSTLLRMLTTLLRPSEGTAYIEGFDVTRDIDAIRRMINIVSEKMLLYPELTPDENLKFFGRLYGLKGKKLQEKVDDLLEIAGLTRWRDKPVGCFSSGMRQRLNVVRSLLNDPQILFLDEPTVALDPQSANFIRSLIVKLAREGRTIIVTTHMMDEADKLCDRIAIMDHGKILAVDEPAKLKEKYNANTLEDVFLELTGREFRDSVEYRLILPRRL